MRILLDTNIVIHREASKVSNPDIGILFQWIDKLHHEKCIHPFTVQEIEKYADAEVVKTMSIKLQNYHILKTEAPINSRLKALSDEVDKNQNDINDSKLLNEVINNRVDFLITEDRKIHYKANRLGISSFVFTIDSFLEKLTSENPSLTNYKVLSVKKEHFGNINLEDSFFDSFREDYAGFDKWFNRKADDIAYICSAEDKTLAFLYLKVEGYSENYVDIKPVFSKKKRLKIGTFKVIHNGFKLGERFLKIIFDNALVNHVDEIYVTIFDKTEEQKRLIFLLQDWGFTEYGEKETPTGIEKVYVRPFSPQARADNPKLTFPYIRKDSTKFIVPIYPAYHTNLLPDSILNTESALDYIENEPFRNALSKVYISRSWEKKLKPGDAVLFYRTGGIYKGVATTIAIVESVITKIENEKQFIELCRKRSVFTDEELAEHWNHSDVKPFIVNFLYAYSLPKRPNLARLIELGLISSVSSMPRGFMRVSEESFQKLLKDSQSDESIIVN